MQTSSKKPVVICVLIYILIFFRHVTSRGTLVARFRLCAHVSSRTRSVASRSSVTLQQAVFFRAASSSTLLPPSHSTLPPSTGSCRCVVLATRKRRVVLSFRVDSCLLQRGRTVAGFNRLERASSTSNKITMTCGPCQCFRPCQSSARHVIRTPHCHYFPSRFLEPQMHLFKIRAQCKMHFLLGSI